MRQEYGVPRFDLEQPYIHGGATVGAVHELAQRILSKLKKVSDVSLPVCLVAEDRSVIAATLLASLAGGPRLLLPHSFSQAVLSELRASMPFCAVVTDVQRELPKDLHVVCEKLVEGKNEQVKFVRDLDEPFVWLFTGGSTGQSSAWSKTPGNLLAEARYLTKYFGILERDVILPTVPPLHIYGLIFSVLIPYVSGASVFAKSSFFPQEIVSRVEDGSCSVLVSSPVHYRALRNSSFDRHGLRVAFSSGGPLNPAHAKAFHSVTGVGVEDIFGSTETGAIANRKWNPGEEPWRVFDAVEWKVEDELLHVSSRFVSPDLKSGSGPLFSTADRVSVDSQNNIRLLGRVDNVIKVGGKRVDLGEVEEAIK
ncbi:MAG: AMP-binding protein, partial [Pseudomonadota bacterium]